MGVINIFHLSYRNKILHFKDQGNNFIEKYLFTIEFNLIFMGRLSFNQILFHMQTVQLVLRMHFIWKKKATYASDFSCDGCGVGMQGGSRRGPWITQIGENEEGLKGSWKGWLNCALERKQKSASRECFPSEGEQLGETWTEEVALWATQK